MEKYSLKINSHIKNQIIEKWEKKMPKKIRKLAIELTEY